MSSFSKGWQITLKGAWSGSRDPL